MKRMVAIIVVVMMLFYIVPNVSADENSTMTVTSMQTDHMTNPIGIDSEKPLFSWSLQDDSVRGQKQTAYRIAVALSEDKLLDGEYVWDSGKVTSDETLDIEYAGDALAPSTRYFWNVTTWDKNGAGTVSQTAYFETGLMDSGWSGAQWIGRSDTKKDGYFELTDFTLEFDVKLVSGAASILFGAEDDSNLYMWQISNMTSHGGGTRFRPHKCTGGSWSVLVNSQLSTDTEYAADYIHMSVTSNGGNVVTKIGDSQIDSRNLGSFKLGYIGFRKQADEKATFDNIVLKDDSGNVVYSESFDDGTADGFSSLPVSDGCAALTGDTTLGVILRYGEERAESAPMLRREFTTATGKTVASARLYATAAGIYEIFINGSKTTDSYLNPGMTAYDDTLMYQTYDVTELVQNGKNAVGAYLGHGWFNKALHSYGSNLYLYAKLLVTYTDGTSESIVTDDSWRFYRYGPILDDDIFNGYKYDATIEATLDGWTQPGFDDSGWDDVSVAAADKIIKNGSVPEIVAQNIPLIRNTITLPAIAMTEPEEGVYIYDFGQNIAGIARVTATAPKGTKMTLRHAEILNRENMQGATGTAGTLYTGNLPRAEATDTYVFRGDKESETFEPTMTYHGFRYLEITGLDEALPPDNVKALLLMTDLEQTSTFDSSNDMVDRLYLNSLWSARDNFMSIPTDCPQRGERFGWTGDAQIFARTGAYMMDINAFYQKYCKDMRDASKDNRIIADIAPPTAPGNGFYGKSTQNRLEATNGWGDAIIIIPYQMYKQYGNKKIIEENYEIMCNWMAYLVETGTDYVRDQSWTGDWLPVNEAKTPIAVTDTAFCAYSATLLAEMAQVLGKTEDAEKYTQLYNSYRNAWRSNFLAEDGYTTLCNTQTSNVLGLKFGLFDEDERQGAAENLVKNIKSWDWHLTTGFLGLSYLTPVLSDN
ncbi:MAG: family 78 glycoside hydrolase catalytic domain, partial [Clostridia bacterium]|nr:family 78 glycoside hydrolase catalytic domain [Clostridia bacterium]